MKREGLSSLGGIQKITEAPANNWINSSVDGGFCVNNPLLTFRHKHAIVLGREFQSCRQPAASFCPKWRLVLAEAALWNSEELSCAKSMSYWGFSQRPRGWSCCWEEELTCFLNWLKFFLWLLLPKYQRGLPGILCSHSITKEMNELRALWKDLILFWKCVLADNLLVQGGICVLFAIFVSLAPSRMQCI